VRAPFGIGHDAGHEERERAEIGAHLDRLRRVRLGGVRFRLRPHQRHRRGGRRGGGPIFGQESERISADAFAAGTQEVDLLRLPHRLRQLLRLGQEDVLAQMPLARLAARCA